MVLTCSQGAITGIWATAQVGGEELRGGGGRALRAGSKVYEWALGLGEEGWLQAKLW